MTLEFGRYFGGIVNKFRSFMPSTIQTIEKKNEIPKRIEFEQDRILSNHKLKRLNFV